MNLVNFRNVTLAFILGGLSVVGHARESFDATCDTPRAAPGDGVDSDDPAIYVNTINPEASIVFGTLQKGGIGSYKLDCKDARLPGLDTEGDIVNVDVMYDFDANGEKIDLLVATSQGRGVYIFKLTPNMQTVEVSRLGFFRVKTAYGLCVYNNKSTGKAAVITTLEEPMEVRIHDLTFSNGEVQMTESRIIRLGSSDDENTGIESCVADNEKGVLYVAQEKFGIHTFWAEESRGNDQGHYQVFRHKNAPSIEGLSIYYGLDGQGYLMVSAEHKKDNHFLVYDRMNAPGTDFQKRAEFEIVAKGRDKVDDTDGIDIINVPLGDRYPSGLFVVQDHDRDEDHIGQFSFMSFESIAERLGLLQDTSRSIRGESGGSDTQNSDPTPTPVRPEPPTTTEPGPSTDDTGIDASSGTSVIVFDPKSLADDMETDAYTFDVICESEDFEATKCVLGAKIERVKLVEQKSSTACIKGEHWGEIAADGFGDHNALVVTKGCRARFQITTKSLRWQQMVCKSKKDETEECAHTDQIFDARLVRELESSSGCDKGDTWMWKSEFRSHILVKDDCDGVFEVMTHYTLDQ